VIFSGKDNNEKQIMSLRLVPRTGVETPGGLSKILVPPFLSTSCQSYVQNGGFKTHPLKERVLNAS
jgi:hypothetical protein